MASELFFFIWSSQESGIPSLSVSVGAVPEARVPTFPERPSADSFEIKAPLDPRDFNSLMR